jgi:hypothetical protein
VDEAILHYLTRGETTLPLPTCLRDLGSALPSAFPFYDVADHESSLQGPPRPPPCVRHASFARGCLLKGDRRFLGPSRLEVSRTLREVRHPVVATSSRLRFKRPLMEIFEAVETYIDRKRSLGVNFEKAPLNLRSFSKRVGDVPSLTQRWDDEPSSLV